MKKKTESVSEAETQTTRSEALEIAAPGGTVLASAGDLEENGEAFEGLPAFQVALRAVECRVGGRQGFYKKHLIDQVLPAVRQAIATAVETEYNELKKPVFERLLPLALSFTVREKFLVGLGDRVEYRGLVTSGAYFKPGRKIYGTINEAFDQLVEEVREKVLSTLEDDRVYVADVTARWVWDPNATGGMAGDAEESPPPEAPPDE